MDYEMSEMRRQFDSYMKNHKTARSIDIWAAGWYAALDHAGRPEKTKEQRTLDAIRELTSQPRLNMPGRYMLLYQELPPSNKVRAATSLSPNVWKGFLERFIRSLPGGSL